MDYREQIERLKQRSNGVVTRYAGYLPDSLVQFWRRSQRPGRWALVGALLGGGFFVLVLPVFVLANLTSPALVFEWVPAGHSIFGVDLRPAFWLSRLSAIIRVRLRWIAKRSKFERVGSIVQRVIVGYLIGALLPGIGLFFPYIAIYCWGRHKSSFL